MKIYVGHSTNFDYQNELYAPLKSSRLWDKHEFVLPHDKTTEPFHSKKMIESCNLLIAEVSFPSTGLGIELGWAEVANVPVIAICREGCKPSSSIHVITDKILFYEGAESLIDSIAQSVNVI